MKRIIEATLKNWFKILMILFLGFAVYWLGIRPCEIRKTCSIFHVHNDAFVYHDGTFVPAEDFMKSASPEQYDQCLHQNGL
jgi:hypothetical protein